MLSRAGRLFTTRPHRAVLLTVLAFDSFVIWRYSGSWLDLVAAILFVLVALGELGPER